REQGTGNREQFQELDRSDFSFESNLNARFLSSHSLKACTFSISNSLKSFTCKVFVFIQPALRKNLAVIGIVTLPKNRLNCSGKDYFCT
ncbi:hypothetical protein PN483_22385, partial [Nodularia spumigena CS-591/04]